MIRNCWFAALLCGALAMPVYGQRTPESATPTKSGGPDIVVRGLRDRDLGTWRQAESDHVIVVSEGDADELTRVTRNLERLHRLLIRLYRPAGNPDDIVKLRVTLLDRNADLGALGLENVRWQQGPYMRPFSVNAYYDPREDGDVLAVVRRDALVKLDTPRAFKADCDDIVQNADPESVTNCSRLAPHRKPLTLSWEQSLYAAFAERFILTYVPANDPRWYLDGIGAIFSTIAVRPDGAIDYARVPEQFQAVIRAYGPVDAIAVLSGRNPSDDGDSGSWSPYHAWLLSHYFLYSGLSPTRSKQFQLYMAAVRQGKPLDEAVTVFGDTAALQREIDRYAQRDFSYAHGQTPEADVPTPVVTALSSAAAALVESRLAIGGNGGGWLETIRSATATSEDPDGLLFAAAAECSGNHPAECLADAQHLLALRPDDAAAITWKGRALTLQALAMSGSGRKALFVAARQVLAVAIARDPKAPLPRIAYLRTFLDADEGPTDDAVLGLAQAIRCVPAAPMPRLLLAQALLKQGKRDLAERVAFSLTHGPFDSPERRAAAALFAGGKASPRGS